jgi:nitrogenase molybdenum-cofactor synthesis protein NifE
MSHVVDLDILNDRKKSIVLNEKGKKQKIVCGKDSTAGAVSQRACVYCGARVVLNPITDAYHIVHGPIGCSSYTWDIRGSLSSGSEIYRNSFCTDMREQDIIFGGEKKLAAAIDEITAQHAPKVIFVYSTCVVGVIGDDIDAVCAAAQKKHGIRVIPVRSTGFAGNKASGYRAACDAILDLIGDVKPPRKRTGLNFLGDFNLAAEQWIVKGYLDEIGVKMHTAVTGDASCAGLRKVVRAQFNIVQCAGSMHYLARRIEDAYGIPFFSVSFCGVEDTVRSLREIARTTGDREVIARTEKLVEKKAKETNAKLKSYRKRLTGKKAAIYVGGGFKAISLIRQFEDLGIETVLVGTQTGREEEYETIRQITRDGTVILDDSNPFELERFIREMKADILVGGVKERPLAYKLGVAFLDHNHERKHPLSGFEGALNFAKEAADSLLSPVWGLIKEDRSDLHEPEKFCQLEC